MAFVKTRITAAACLLLSQIPFSPLTTILPVSHAFRLGFQLRRRTLPPAVVTAAAAASSSPRSGTWTSTSTSIASVSTLCCLVPGRDETRIATRGTNHNIHYNNNKHHRPNGLALFSASRDTMASPTPPTPSPPVSSFFAKPPSPPSCSDGREETEQQQRQQQQPPEHDQEQYTVESLRGYAEQLILENKQQLLHGLDHKICVFLAGGGSMAVSILAATPGASSLLLEGRTTYDRHSFLDACGVPDRDTMGQSFSYGSRRAAGMAARAALQQALVLASMDDDLRTMPKTIGIGCASVLVSNTCSNSNINNGGESYGTGTVVAVSADGLVLTLGIRMNQPRSRFDEELVLSHLVLRAAELLTNRRRREGGTHDERVAIMDDTTHQEYATRAGDLVTERWEWSPTLSSLTIGGESNDATTATATANADAADAATPTMGQQDNTNAVIEEAARRVVDHGEDAVVLLPLYNSISNNDDDNTTEKSIGIRALSQTILPNRCLVFPGSFNPPHVGHLSLAKASIQTLEKLEPYAHPRNYNEKPILFELSLTNVDKPSIDPKIVASRVQKFLELATAAAAAASSETNSSDAFPQQWGIVLTRAPLFEEKLRILRSKVLNRLEGPGDSPRINFVIGTDTFVRILDPKYYRDQSLENRDGSLLELKGSGAGFVVGGRLEQGAGTASPRFVSGKEELVNLSERVASMFTTMEESEFRVDLSSSELRAQHERTETEGQSA